MGIIIQGQTIIKGRTIIGDPIPGILIGYRAATSPTYINDWTTTFTSLTCTVPVYMRKSDGYTFGQIPTNYSPWVIGNPFFNDIMCTTPIPNQGGSVLGFSCTLGGSPDYQIRIDTTYSGASGDNTPTEAVFGYYVTSATKVNVGSTNRLFTRASYVSLAGAVPYRAMEVYDSAPNWIQNTTIAWAALPNVTATHLLTFIGGSYVYIVA